MPYGSYCVHCMNFLCSDIIIPSSRIYTQIKKTVYNTKQGLTEYLILQCDRAEYDRFEYIPLKASRHPK